MSFIKYPSLENHYQEKFIRECQLVNEDLEKEEYILQEKIHGCLDYDSIVETIEFGPMKIGDIVINKVQCHVKSFDIVNGISVNSKVLGFSEQENLNDWYEIELEDGTILTVTGNHRIWLPKLQCWRKVEDLNQSDHFLINEK